MSFLIFWECFFIVFIYFFFFFFFFQLFLLVHHVFYHSTGLSSFVVAVVCVYFGSCILISQTGLRFFLKYDYSCFFVIICSCRSQNNFSGEYVSTTCIIMPFTDAAYQSSQARDSRC